MIKPSFSSSRASVLERYVGMKRRGSSIPQRTCFSPWIASLPKNYTRI